MRGCHHDLGRERKGKGVTKAGRDGGTGKGEGRERCCTVTVATNPSNMVTFPNSEISSHASNHSFPCHFFRTCDDARPHSVNLISYPYRSSLCCRRRKCPPRFFFFSHVYIRCYCHVPRFPALDLFLLFPEHRLPPLSCYIIPA